MSFEFGFTGRVWPLKTEIPPAREAREVVDRGPDESRLSEGTRDATDDAGVSPRWRAYGRGRGRGHERGRRGRRAKGFVARDARRREMAAACGRQIAAHRGPQQKPASAASHERRRRDADLWAATWSAAPRGIGVQRRFRDRAAGGPGVAMSDGGEEGLAWWPSRRCRRAKRGIQVRRRRDSITRRGCGIGVEV